MALSMSIGGCRDVLLRPSTEKYFGIIMNVACCFQFRFTHPPMLAVLAVQDDGGTVIQPQLVGQHDIVGSKAAQSIAI